MDSKLIKVVVLQIKMPTILRLLKSSKNLLRPTKFLQTHRNVSYTINMAKRDWSKAALVLA